jgi:hypothetical protein
MKVERSALKCETLWVGKGRSLIFREDMAPQVFFPRVRRRSLPIGYQSSPLGCSDMEDIKGRERSVAPNRPVFSMREIRLPGDFVKTV